MDVLLSSFKIRLPLSSLFLISCSFLLKSDLTHPSLFRYKNIHSTSTRYQHVSGKGTERSSNIVKDKTSGRNLRIDERHVYLFEIIDLARITVSIFFRYAEMHWVNTCTAQLVRYYCCKREKGTR